MRQELDDHNDLVFLPVTEGYRMNSRKARRVQREGTRSARRIHSKGYGLGRGARSDDAVLTCYADGSW